MKIKKKYLKITDAYSNEKYNTSFFLEFPSKILKKLNSNITCKWLATFSLLSHGTFIKSSIFLGPTSAKQNSLVTNNFMCERYDDELMTVLTNRLCLTITIGRPYENSL